MTRPDTHSARPARTVSTYGSSGNAQVRADSSEAALLVRARSSRYAVAAAACSASFLLRPVLAAYSSPRTQAWAVNVLAWSGPEDVITYSGTPALSSAVSSWRLVFQSRPAPWFATSLSRPSNRAWMTSDAT